MPMLTDYHIHILPGMDDGAENTRVSRDMLTALSAQGIGRVISTSHFYPHHESIEDFLKRREEAFIRLTSVTEPGMPQIIKGAEVRLQRHLSENEKLDSLTLGESNFILLELPFHAYQDWMKSELLEILYSFHLRLLIAHLDRYLLWYKPAQIREILSIEDAVLQISNSALLEKKSLKFVLDIIGAGYPVVFGSDAHDMLRRPPDFDKALPILKAKLSPSEYEHVLHLNQTLVST